MVAARERACCIAEVADGPAIGAFPFALVDVVAEDEEDDTVGKDEDPYLDVGGLRCWFEIAAFAAAAAAALVEAADCVGGGT